MLHRIGVAICLFRLSFHVGLQAKGLDANRPFMTGNAETELCVRLTAVWMVQGEIFEGDLVYAGIV